MNTLLEGADFDQKRFIDETRSRFPKLTSIIGVFKSGRSVKVVFAGVTGSINSAVYDESYSTGGNYRYSILLPVSVEDLKACGVMVPSM